ncbi:LCP family protein [Actinomadura litoris]|uniref:LytR family transcriptional regulator n=1 Tax=Actinomadura litoris TaxID=2678616 RepID=A0A7K1KXD7_9ACTN|nr:LCP family protein [Actinomadura litoris]MUN36727.1 LytR family transcriptional regulator [Actinomadura litoris]
MDDLELLRGLGRELEHEPPGTLARQRRRLLEAPDGRRATPGRSGRLRRPGGPAGWSLIGAVAMVTAALVLIPGVVLRGAGKPVLGGAKHLAFGTGKTLNVLLVGSDSRGGGAARSDTLVLVHLPADRKNVRAVSIPRDTLVRVPSCKADGGRVVPARVAPVNSAFALGVACTHRTVESVAGVEVDTSVVVDFTGFAKIVDVLGGVELTIPRAVSDPPSGLSLRPGRQRLDGRQALAYARVRHGLGDGSDLARIERQQKLMSALLKEAREQRLRDPARYAKFLAMSARSVSTYPRLDVGALEAVARGMEKTGADAVRFSTVPVKPAPQDPNRVALDGAAAERLFAQFRK